eukprot:TRINITY_DN1531_c0_g1_i1.p1 TRINITY_DN1531_c0_g1~~TRINITY_DN1531_c0_g1_i1.p1  ORF type:complete len:683 (+),score=136.27 TRINITY_DN1531_c0_g1_i1:50-2098(+)
MPIEIDMTEEKIPKNSRKGSLNPNTIKLSNQRMRESVRIRREQNDNSSSPILIDLEKLSKKKATDTPNTVNTKKIKKTTTSTINSSINYSRFISRPKTFRRQSNFAINNTICRKDNNNGIDFSRVRTAVVQTRKRFVDESPILNEKMINMNSTSQRNTNHINGDSNSTNNETSLNLSLHSTAFNNSRNFDMYRIPLLKKSNKKSQAALIKRKIYLDMRVRSIILIQSCWRAYICRHTDGKELYFARLRKEIVEEILQAEKTFNDQLNLLIEIKNRFKAQDCFMNDQNIDLLFGNIEDLLIFSTNLLNSLNKSLNLKKDPLLWRYPISKIVLEYTEKMKIFAVYAANFDVALQVLRKNAKNTRMNSVLYSFNYKVLSFDNLLLTPIKRVPMYPMLWEKLKKRTPPEHEQYNNCCLCLEACKEIVTYVNTEKRKYDQNLKKIDELKSLNSKYSTQLEDCDFVDSVDVTELIANVDLKQRRVLLFEDRLIFLTEKFLGGLTVKHEVFLNSLKVSNFFDSLNEFILILEVDDAVNELAKLETPKFLPANDFSYAINLKFKSKNTRDFWRLQIQNTIEKFKEHGFKRTSDMMMMLEEKLNTDHEDYVLNPSDMDELDIQSINKRSSNENSSLIETDKIVNSRPPSNYDIVSIISKFEAGKVSENSSLIFAPLYSDSQLPAPPSSLIN